eukprot:633885-Pleurochrysis_carterae.AAC.2
MTGSVEVSRIASTVQVSAMSAPLRFLPSPAARRSAATAGKPSDKLAGCFRRGTLRRAARTRGRRAASARSRRV